MVRLLLVVVSFLGCARPSGRIRIAASTTLIGTIVQTVGGDRFAVTTIAPAGLCPGQFDLKPSDITAANQARLLLNHGWEGWFPRLEKAMWTADTRKVTLATKGNWMIPDVQKRATAEIAALLMELDSARADTYRLASESYQARVDSAAATARTMLAGKTLPAVIAAE